MVGYWILKEELMRGAAYSTLSMLVRRKLHRELTMMAFEANMPIRSFVLEALKAKGLNVQDIDIEDKRTKRWKEENGVQAQNREP
jgi:hypothetical protein